MLQTPSPARATAKAASAHSDRSGTGAACVRASRPIARDSVNHNAPSGPVVIPAGPALGVGMGNSETTPVRVIRPILLTAPSVNHNAPSGPAVIQFTVLTGNSVTAPDVVILPMAAVSVNQRRNPVRR